MMSRYCFRSTFFLGFLISFFLFPFLRPVTAQAQWTAIAPNLNATPEDFFGCLTFKDGLLCFGDRYVKVSQDSGVTWRLASLNPPLKLRPTGFVTEIRFYNKRFGVLGTGNGYVYVTQDGGATWQAVLEDPPHSYTALTFMGSPMDIMIGTWDTSKVYITSDFGQTWSTDAIALGGAFAAPFPSVPPCHYYVTTDRGQTWTQKPFQIDYDTYSFAIDECDPQTLYSSSEHRMVVDDGISKMFVTHDYGLTGSVTLRRQEPNLGTSIATTPNAVYCGSTYGVCRGQCGALWTAVYCGPFCRAPVLHRSLFHSPLRSGLVARGLRKYTLRWEALAKRSNLRASRSQARRLLSSIPPCADRASLPATIRSPFSTCIFQITTTPAH
jgi:hypothetical protein